MSDTEKDLQLKNGRWYYKGFNMGADNEIVNNQHGYSTGETVSHWITKECLFVSDTGQPYVNEY